MGIRTLVPVIGLLSLGAFAAPNDDGSATTENTPTKDDAAQAASTVVPAPKPVIRHLPLSDLTTYEIGIRPDCPTTILLPSVPTSFQGTGFTRDPNQAAAVFLDYSAGATFFSVKPLLPGAEANLNLVIDGKIYNFHFYLSATPARAITFSKPTVIPEAQPTIRVSRSQLIRILDSAKSYHLIKDSVPELARTIEVSAPGNASYYPGFSVIVDYAYKFAQYDTIVFRVLFINERDKELTYSPGSLATRIGANVYFASIADAAGVVPAAHIEPVLDKDRKPILDAQGQPKLEKKTGQAFAYFAITGNPDGTRARISLANTFNILVDEASPNAPATR